MGQVTDKLIIPNSTLCLLDKWQLASLIVKPIYFTDMRLDFLTTKFFVKQIRVWLSFQCYSIALIGPKNGSNSARSGDIILLITLTMSSICLIPGSH